MIAFLTLACSLSVPSNSGSTADPGSDDSNSPDDSGLVDDTGVHADDTATTDDTGSTDDTGETNPDLEDLIYEVACTQDGNDYSIIMWDAARDADDVIVVGHYSEGYQAYREAQGQPVENVYEDVKPTIAGDDIALECNWWPSQPGETYEFFTMDSYEVTVVR